MHLVLVICILNFIDLLSCVPWYQNVKKRGYIDNDGFFYCNNHKKYLERPENNGILVTQVCDGSPDCPELDDEVDCPTSTCPIILGKDDNKLTAYGVKSALSGTFDFPICTVSVNTWNLVLWPNKGDQPAPGYINITILSNPILTDISYISILDYQLKTIATYNSSFQSPLNTVIKVNGPWVMVVFNQANYTVPDTLSVSWNSGPPATTCDSGVISFYTKTTGDITTINSNTPEGYPNRDCTMWIIPGGIFIPLVLPDSYGIYSYISVKFTKFNMSSGDSVTVTYINSNNQNTKYAFSSTSPPNASSLIFPFIPQTIYPPTQSPGLQIITHTGSQNNLGWEIEISTEADLRGLGWICLENEYNSTNGCDCGCGIYDPECLNTNVVINHCDVPYQKCDNVTATCVPNFNFDLDLITIVWLGSGDWENPQHWNLNRLPNTTDIVMVPGGITSLFLQANVTITAMVCWSNLWVDLNTTTFIMNINPTLFPYSWIKFLSLGTHKNGNPIFVINYSTCNFEKIETPYMIIEGESTNIPNGPNGVSVIGVITTMGISGKVTLYGIVTCIRTVANVDISISSLTISSKAVVSFMGVWSFSNLEILSGSFVYLDSEIFIKGPLFLINPNTIDNLLVTNKAGPFLNVNGGSVTINATTTILDVPIIGAETVTVNSWNTINLGLFGSIYTDDLIVAGPANFPSSVPNQPFLLNNTILNNGWNVNHSVNTTISDLTYYGDFYFNGTIFNVQYMKFRILQIFYNGLPSFQSTELSNVTIINGILQGSFLQGTISIIDAQGGTYNFYSGLSYDSIMIIGRKAFVSFSQDVTINNLLIDGIHSLPGSNPSIIIVNSFIWDDSLMPTGDSVYSSLILDQLTLQSGSSMIIQEGVNFLRKLQISQIICNGMITVQSSPVQFVNSEIYVNENNCTINFSGHNQTNTYTQNEVTILIGSNGLSSLTISNGGKIRLNGTSTQVQVSTIVIKSGTLEILSGEVIVTESFMWDCTNLQDSIITGGGVLTISEGARLELKGSCNKSNLVLETNILMNGNMIVNTVSLVFQTNGMITISNTGVVNFTTSNVNVQNGIWQNYGLVQTFFGPNSAIFLGTFTSYNGSMIIATNGALEFDLLKLEVLKNVFYTPCCYFNTIYPSSYDGIDTDNAIINIDTTTQNTFKNIRIKNGGTLYLSGDNQLSLDNLEIYSGSLIGPSVSIVVNHNFTWEHISDVNSSSTIDVNITLSPSCYTYLNSKNYGSGVKILKSPLKVNSNSIIAGGDVVQYFGGGHIYLFKDSTIIDPSPNLSISNSKTCPLICKTSTGKRATESSAPIGWTCSDDLYADGISCDCGCGLFDIDCLNSNLQVLGCSRDETCSNKGTCENIDESTISFDNYGKITTNYNLNKTISVNNYPGAIIDATQGSLIFDSFTYSIQNTEVIIGSQIKLDGVIQDNTASSLTFMESISTLLVDFMINTSFTWYNDDYLATITIDGNSSSIIISPDTQVIIGGNSSKRLNNANIICHGNVELYRMIDFSGTAYFSLESDGTMQIFSPQNSIGGNWINSGNIVISVSVPSINFGKFMDKWSTSLPTGGTIKVITGLMESTFLQVLLDDDVIFNTTVMGLQSIGGNFNLSSLQMFQLVGGNYTFNSSIPINMDTLSIQNGASLVINTIPSVSIKTFYLYSSSFYTDSPISISDKLIWDNDNSVIPSVVEGSSNITLLASSNSSIGNIGTSNGVLILNGAIISQGYLYLYNFYTFTFGPRSSMIDIINTLYVHQIQSNNNVINVDKNAIGFVNSGTLIILNGLGSRTILGKLKQYSQGILNTNMANVEFTSGLILYNTNPETTLLNGTSTMVVHGLFKVDSITSITFSGGSSDVNVMDSSINITNLIVKNGANVDIEGGSNFTVANMSLETGSIIGNAPITITNSGMWIRQNILAGSTIDGSGMIFISKDATFYMDSLSLSLTQSLGSNRILIVEGIIKFGNSWFTKSKNNFNVMVEPSGIFDVSNIRSGTVSLHVTNKGVILGPQTSLPWDTLTLNGGNITIGMSTSILVKNFKIQNNYDTIFNSSNTVIIIGPVYGLSFTQLTISGVTYFDSVLPLTANFQTLTLLPGAILYISNNFNINAKNLVLQSSIINNGFISILNLFSWKVVSQDSSINGNGIIQISKSATMEINGNPLNTYSISMSDQNINNYGQISITDTIGISALKGTIYNYNTTNIHITTPVLQLGTIINKDIIEVITESNQMKIDSLTNEINAQINIIGIGIIEVGDFNSSINSEFSGLTNGLYIDGNAILEGLIEVPIFVRNNGRASIYDTVTISDNLKVIDGGTLVLETETNYRGIIGCVLFDQGNVAVTLKTAVRNMISPAIPLEQCSTSSKRSTFIQNLGTINNSYVINTASINSTIYDVCEIPTAQLMIYNNYIAIQISTVIQCSSVSYNCSDPSAMFHSCANCSVGKELLLPSGICQDINECKYPVCSKHSTCSNGDGTVNCTCNNGWIADQSITPIGRVCLSICNTSTCKQCLDTPTRGIVCSNCDVGYLENTTTGVCTDIDECTLYGASPCIDSLRPCINTYGSYFCTSCPRGYIDDTDITCADLNECSSPFLNGCGDTTCTNIPGGYICEKCPEGSVLVNGNCEYIDSCQLGVHQCSLIPPRQCISSYPNPYYTCGDCPTGYINSGDLKCQDIDECAIGTPCNDNRTCLNSPGSYSCGACDSNYYYTGPTSCTLRNIELEQECVTDDTAYIGFTSHYLSPHTMIPNDYNITTFLPGRQYYQISVPYSDSTGQIVLYLDYQQYQYSISSFPVCTPDYPQMKTATYNIREMAIDNLQLGVAVVRSTFSEDVYYRTPCSGDQTLYQYCNPDSSLCLNDKVGDHEVGSLDFKATILNPDTCKEIVFVVTSQGTNTGTITISGGNYATSQTINKDPARSQDYIIVCCQDFRDNSINTWSGDLSLSFDLPSDLEARVSILNVKEYPIRDWYFQTNPILKCGDNIMQCTRYFPSSSSFVVDCTYIDLPSTQTPLLDYQLMIAGFGVPQNVSNNTISSAIVLWYMNISDSPTYIFDQNKFSEGCELFYGTVSDKDGHMSRDVVPLIKEVTPCSYDFFNQVKKNFEDAISQFGSTIDFTSIQQTALAYAFSDVWQDCSTQVQELLLNINTSCESTSCCGNNNNNVIQIASESNVKSMCKYPKCSFDSASLFAQVQTSALDTNRGCDASTRDILNSPEFQSSTFTSCYIYTFGQRCSPYPESELDGRVLLYDPRTPCSVVDPASFCLVSGQCTLPCTNNSQCPSGICRDYGYYKSCDIMPTSDDKDLVQCLTQKINPYLMLYIQQEINNNDRSNTEFQTKFLNAIVQPQCEGAIMKTEPLSAIQCQQQQYCNWATCQIDNQDCTVENCIPTITPNHLGNQNFYCALCQESAFGQVCTEVSEFGSCVIIDTEVSQDGPCQITGFSWNLLSPYPCKNIKSLNSSECNPPQYCNNQVVCNSLCYFSQYNSSTCELNIEGALWTTWTVGNNSYSLCVLNNVSRSDCTGTWRPGTQWIDPLLNNQQICESHGFCRDSSTMAYQQCPTAGICSVNCPGCDEIACRAAGFCNNHVGCITPSSNSVCSTYGEIWTPFGCLDIQVTDNTSCINLGKTWIDTISSEEDCLKITLCRDNSTIDFTEISNNLKVISIPSGWIPTEQCNQCSGTLKSVYSWTPGQWYPNVLQNFTWLPRAVSNFKSERTVNTDELNNLVSNAKSVYASTIVKTGLLCKFGKSSDLLDRLSCDCTGGSNDCLELLEGVSQITIGFYTVCESINYVNQVFSDGIISTEGQVIVGGVSDGFVCADIKVTTIPLSQFQYKQTVSLSSNIVIPDLQTLKAEVQYIKNSNGIVIGQMVGNGVGFSWQTQLSGVTICVHIPPNVRNQINSDLNFAYLDLAIPITDDYQKFQLVNLRVDINSNVPYLCTPYEGDTKVYFPVVLLKGYESITYIQTWSSAVLGLFYFALAVYFLLFLLGIYNIYLHFQNVYKFNFNTIAELPRMIMIIITIFLLIRVIFFIVVPFGVLESIPPLQIIFSELPVLIFFSSFVFQVVRWAEIYHYASKLQQQTSLLRLAVGLNIALYLFFILVLILYFTVPSAPLIITCTTPDSQINQLRFESVLALVYKAFFILACLICAAGFIFYGTSIVKSMTRSKEVKNKATTISRLRKMALLMLMVTLSLIANAIMLILSSTGIRISALALVIFLLIVEICPTVAIFYIYSAQSFLHTFRAETRRTTESHSRFSHYYSREESRGTVELYQTSPGRRSKTTRVPEEPKLKIKKSPEESPIKLKIKKTDNDKGDTDIELKKISGESTE